MIDQNLNVAILGASGIGKVHARIFNELGCNICSILGSTDQSVATTLQTLKNEHNLRTTGYSSLATLLKQRPDAISICTPPELHYDEIISSFDHGIPVLCEKPFFWHCDITHNEIIKKLDLIENHPNRQIFINTSHANLMRYIRPKLKTNQPIKTFRFTFHTLGKNQFQQIGVDLLPHGISLLLDLLGPKTLNEIDVQLMKTQYLCKFTYGNVHVSFDFQENKNLQKKFIIEINGQKFERIQSVENNIYKIFIKELETGLLNAAEDPFVSYIRNFINYCRTGNNLLNDGFVAAKQNLLLMSTILLDN